MIVVFILPACLVMDWYSVRRNYLVIYLEKSESSSRVFRIKLLLYTNLYTNLYKQPNIVMVNSALNTSKIFQSLSWIMNAEGMQYILCTLDTVLAYNVSVIEKKIFSPWQLVISSEKENDPLFTHSFEHNTNQKSQNFPSSQLLNVADVINWTRV